MLRHFLKGIIYTKLPHQIYRVSGNPLSRTNNNQFQTSSLLQKNKQEITKLPITDEEKAKERKLKIIQMEIDILHESENDAPNSEQFSTEDWNHLLTLDSQRHRKKYYRFIFLKQQFKSRKELEKKENKIKAFEYQKNICVARQENKHIIYGLGHNSIFLRIFPRTIKKWLNAKLCRAQLFGIKIIFDCSYDKKMNDIEKQATGRQLHFCFAANRQHKHPFNMYFCNIDVSGKTVKSLQKHIPTVFDKSFPLNVQQECYTQLFPHERLLYLTPDSDNELLAYDPNDIYIIGAIVDKGPCQPLSLAKAKQLNIRHARLPLEKYKSWTTGSSKRLSLDVMLKILLDFKETRDWNKALVHIPRRKIEPETQNNEKCKVLPKKKNGLIYDE